MSTQTINLTEAIVEMIVRMPVDSVLTQHNVSWVEYEDLLDSVGANGRLRISYDEGTLQIRSPSSKHEYYGRLIERLVDLLSVRQRIEVLFYGSTTIKRQRDQKGVEPDACFYVQTAGAVGTKEQIDFNTDPPPDVVVEIDIHRDSTSKFPIYLTLGVPECWRYDGASLTIYHLQNGRNVLADASRALPILTSAVLTEFLSRGAAENQYHIVLAFEEWLKGQTP